MKKTIDANSSISYQYIYSLDFQLGTPIEISSGFRQKKNTNNQNKKQKPL